MSTSPRLAFAIISAASLFQVACADLPADPGEAVAETEQAVPVMNALSANALSANALSANALSANALSANALSANALSANALVSEALEDPLAREFLSYVVSCALPQGAHFDLEIQGDVYGFDGGLGLAPEWGEEDGYCNDDCRSWVSACVLSRVNYLGDEVIISVRGKHPALNSTLEERQDYPHREATYYGDIFTFPQERYACLSPGEDEIPRVCGPSVDDCVMDVVGPCDWFCHLDKKDGSYNKCLDASPYLGGKKHKGAVTVFLAP
jgi:hypothetical protein